MFCAHDVGVKNTGSRSERVNSRIDTQLGDRARKVGGGVKVSKGSGRRRIGVVICRNVDGLNGGDGAPLGGSNALLQIAHLGCQIRLIADR